MNAVTGKETQLSALFSAIDNKDTLHERELTIPFVDIFEYTGHLISAYKIYIDISALYAD